MAIQIVSSTELTALLERNAIVLVHFTSPDCAVCGVLQPRLATLATEFPRALLAAVDCQAAPAVAAQQQVFAVPTVLLYVQGREAQRWARNLHLAELREAVARPYQMLFDDDNA